MVDWHTRKNINKASTPSTSKIPKGISKHVMTAMLSCKMFISTELFGNAEFDSATPFPGKSLDSFLNWKELLGGKKGTQQRLVRSRKDFLWHQLKKNTSMFSSYCGLLIRYNLPLANIKHFKVFLYSSFINFFILYALIILLTSPSWRGCYANASKYFNFQMVST